MDKYNTQKEIILAVIPYGKGDAIKSKEIYHKTGIKPRTLRSIVNSLRDEGYPICSNSYNGYWIPLTSVEIRETINQLQNHINTLTLTINNLLKLEDENDEN